MPEGDCVNANKPLKNKENQQSWFKNPLFCASFFVLLQLGIGRDRQQALRRKGHHPTRSSSCNNPWFVLFSNIWIFNAKLFKTGFLLPIFSLWTSFLEQHICPISWYMYRSSLRVRLICSLAYFPTSENEREIYVDGPRGGSGSTKRSANTVYIYRSFRGGEHCAGDWIPCAIPLRAGRLHPPWW